MVSRKKRYANRTVPLTQNCIYPQVRSARSLTLLSHALKLSLLLSQEPIQCEEEVEDKQEGLLRGHTLDDEAIALIHSTVKSKEECARYIEEILGKNIDR